MTIHQPLAVGQTSRYSTLSGYMGSSIPPAGGSTPRIVPIIPFKRASKWDATVNKPRDAFTVHFGESNMTPERGVDMGKVRGRSAQMLTTEVVRGGEIVGFPSSGKKVQLRIVVSDTHKFVPPVGDPPDPTQSRHSGPAMTSTS
jgi:hypothetical protein